MPSSEPIPVLSPDQIREWIAAQVPLADFRGGRVLLIVPDNTRTAPLLVL